MVKRMDIVDFLLDRNIANLPRWHQKPVVGQRETTDAHHYWVSWLAGCLSRHLMSKGYDIDLIVLYEEGMSHDRSEEVTGDIPGSFKRDYPPAREAIHQWEIDAIPHLFEGLWPDVRKHFQERVRQYLAEPDRLERQIIKFADVLTAFAFADDQIRIGNQRFLKTRKTIAEELTEKAEEYTWTQEVDGLDRLLDFARQIILDWRLGHEHPS